MLVTFTPLVPVFSGDLVYKEKEKVIHSKNTRKKTGEKRPLQHTHYPGCETCKRKKLKS